MSDLPTPINRHEQYLNAIANGTTDNLPTPPITREEVFLDYIARNGGGSGSGEVTGVKGNAESNYRKGNVNITPENIGLGNVNNTSDANKPVSTAQQTALDGKVDKVVGKGLSTNDYDNTAKGIVDGVTSALAGKADVSSLANYASLDNSGGFPNANNVTKELVYINGFQSDLTNYPSEVSNTIGILLTRWFYDSGDLTVPRMQLVFTLVGKSFCRFFDGTSWTSWSSTSVGILSDLTTTDKSSCVGAINEVNGKIGNLSTGRLRFYPIVAQNNIVAVNPPKANSYSIASLTILGNPTEIPEATGGVTDGYVITAKSATDGYLHIGLVGSYGSGNVNKGNCLNLLLDIT